MATTVTNLYGNNERVTLPAPIWTGNERTGTGYSVQAIYRGPRTGRMFALYYSVWQRHGDSAIEGENYAEIDESEYLRLCRLVGVEPVGVVAEAA